MERPIIQPVGTPAEELDTPALVVDLGVMEQNIAVLHDAVGGSADRSSQSYALMSSCHGLPRILPRSRWPAENSARGCGGQFAWGSRGICRRAKTMLSQRATY